MSARKYVDIWCDVETCGVWCEEATSHTAREARRIAKSLGWVVGLHGGVDLCPRCAAAAGVAAQPEGGEQ